MTVYLGCILIAEEFIEDALGLSDSDRGAIEEATWDAAGEAITLTWNDRVAHLPWSSIKPHIPEQPPTPISACVEHGVGICLTFKGESQGPFLRLRQHDQTVFRHGVLTTREYQRFGTAG